MKKFNEYKKLDLIKISRDIADFWKKNNTFRKSVDNRSGAAKFVFYEGPPSANGLPGIHHVMSRTLKDIFCRFQTQNGKQVFRKAGWDTHGLPVELGIEKELGITKEDIGHKISVKDYNAACKNAVMRYTDVWNDLTEKIGYWVDTEHPYLTYKPKYMETVWWLLKEIYQKNLLYKGYTVQPYSPKAGTGLSSHELNQPGTYKDVTDITIVAQFRAKKETSPLLKDYKDEVYFLAWTTTPWTLPSNTALVVGKEIDYVLVKTYNQYTHKTISIIFAKSLLKKLLGTKYTEGTEKDLSDYRPETKIIPYQIIKEFKGKEILNTVYEQLIPWFFPAENPDKAFRVIAGDFVTTEEGTGIVHSAPTFGADDARVAKENGVPPMRIRDKDDNLMPLVDLQGKFVKGENVPEIFAGKYVKNEYYDEGHAPEKSWDVEMAILLKTENKAFKVEKYTHSYPHCWRTDKPILYYPLDSWFIKMSALKDRLVTLNTQINWKPKSTGEGRFAGWLENINDWNLSRSRYWGIPLPIWRTEDLKEERIIGSVKELYNEIEKSIAEGFMKENPFSGFKVGDMSEENYAKVDLHKDTVDDIILVSDTGKPMKREPDLIDVWFDSGSMPYAQFHYPFENKELIDRKKMYPADFIAEGVDQTRGWFYTLHAISTAVFDSVAYENVVSNGLVLDKNGQKMSKRLGNAVDPFETLSTYGPDATRWYMVSNANPWENLRFDIEGIDEVRRKFFGTLYNTYSFFALYANVDGFSYKEQDLEERTEMDRWILSELNILINEVKSYYENYEPTKATRAISTFVNDNLSNWYVRLCRRRFWKGNYSQDKISAYQTLYTSLITVAKLSAPIAPFFMDKLYKDLNDVTQKEKAESVHLSDFPKTDPTKIEEDLVEKTHLAQQITSMVFSLRKKESLKVRQPLQRIMIPVVDKKLESQILAMAELIKQEVNVKEIELIDAEKAGGVLLKQIRPNFRSLGPKLGKEMKPITEKIIKMDRTQISALEKEGKIKILGFDISRNDVEIITREIPGWKVINEGRLTVALDITLTQSLIAEGIAREFVNRIQNLRKEKNFDLTDRIKIILEENSTYKEELTSNAEYICREVLAGGIEFASSLETFELIEINEAAIKVEIIRKKKLT
ncbi:MAG: isoleucine--tRNA ligase [Bergeyella sp.]|nr:isoleucine--tRNA ligase [Bergeyella sp.]